MPNVSLVTKTGGLVARVSIPALNPPPMLLEFDGRRYIQRTYASYEEVETIMVPLTDTVTPPPQS